MALHGGSGAVRGHDYRAVTSHMRTLIEKGRQSLLNGASALEVVVEVVAAMEDSGLYIAGRGASPNVDGQFELDASVMNGVDAMAGSVAALAGFQSAIRVARAVMDSTPHVLLAGGGAAAFARDRGFPPITDPGSWFTPAATFEQNRLPPGAGHGTVGCVALDAAGHLASATSTGGVFGKQSGRVGDTALIGAGTWADKRVAISCTGHGEFFIRSAAAAQVAHRVQFRGESLEASSKQTLGEIAARGGAGGLIAIDSDGNVTMPFVGTGMKRAALLMDGTVLSEAP